MYPRISINIVAWNSMGYLPELLASISAQTYRDFNVLVIDNASADGVAEFLAREYPSVVLIRNAKNRGFSYAHNQGIRYAVEHWAGSDLRDRFVLVTNPDIVLTPDFLERLVAGAAATPAAGSCGGKVFLAHQDSVADEELRITVKTDRLDTTGLLAHRDRTFTDRGAGEVDRGQYDAANAVFGFSGALVLYRASALAEAAPDFAYFDNNFFAYKEDVDLAWRLQNLGFAARFIPAARAYHHRQMFGAEHLGWWQKFKNRLSKSKRRSYFSTRNQLLLPFKNEYWANYLLALPFIWFCELRRFLFVLIFEIANLKAYWHACVLLPAALRQRSATRSRWRASPAAMRHWFL
jgi:GT2 family glycosyltransferase